MFTASYKRQTCLTMEISSSSSSAAAATASSSNCSMGGMSAAGASLPFFFFFFSFRSCMANEIAGFNIENNFKTITLHPSQCCNYVRLACWSVVMLERWSVVNSVRLACSEHHDSAGTRRCRGPSSSSG